MSENNKLTRMIMGQEYDTESANMIFSEEDIDWKVMNIKMTIDKTGKQHPSWLYTPLYTQEYVTPVAAVVDKIIVEPNTIDVPESPQPDTKLEYDTISVNESFDVETGDWRHNEAFRLTFDPTGKIRPYIELLVNGNDMVDDTGTACTDTGPEGADTGPEGADTGPEGANTGPEGADTGPECADTGPPIADTGPPITDTGPPIVDTGAESTEPDITEPVKEPPKQPDVVIGQTINEGGIFETLNLSAKYTFILPDIHQFGRDLGGFIKDELIDIHMLHSLTTNGGINWWSDIKGCCKLFPLWTLGNEASLLSAVNFVLSGFNNHVLPLHSSLHSMLLNPLINKSIKQRWSYELWSEQSKMCKSVYSLDELEKRWQNVIQGSFFDYLNNCVTNPQSAIIQTKRSHVEPIHIYMLANLLCRPIIVLSGVVEVEESLSKNNLEITALTGIYLPLEQKVENCNTYPIVLGYHDFHFSALVTSDIKMNTLANVNSPVCVPVTDSYLSLLPLHFLTYPGPEWKPNEIDDPKQIPELTDDKKIDELVKYLHLVRVRFSKQSYDWQTKYENKEQSPSENEDESKHYNILTAAKTNINKTPNDYGEMVRKYANGARKRHNKMIRKKVKCKGDGCSKIPSSQLGGVCVQCYQRTLLNNMGSK